MLYPNDFDDLKRVTSEGQQKAFMLERAILADRSAAFRGPYTAPTSRTVASALNVGKTSRWWWEPIRRQMLRYASVPESIIDRNLEGYGATDPAYSNTGSAAAAAAAAVGPGPGVPAVEPLGAQGAYKPVITYISRQSSRRRLTAAAHADLVKALEERAKKLDFELVIIEAEKLTKEEQIAIAARTTVSPRRLSCTVSSSSTDFLKGTELTHVFRSCSAYTAMVSRIYFGCRPHPGAGSLKCFTKAALRATVSTTRGARLAAQHCVRLLTM